MKRILILVMGLLVRCTPVAVRYAGANVDIDHPCSAFEDPDAVLAESQGLTASGQLADAFACLEAGAEKFPEFADVWEALGTAAE
eukprot:CAMPEP_0172196692 /NCGR_PEP_ID=MMETSP1050-20130122/26978_1 /TAXON_ID=233186 /ORGANISM="Cryptomonas curvata, Strain CCAP979/52" /LENGTH=84 /DNA_ID=CAMNT_0012873041 /DNA_START=22 /DNA_END=273 /DNA_ORIENTATION=+